VGIVITTFLEWLHLLPLALIQRHLVCTGSGPGTLMACLKAAILGLLTPLCSCGALPVAMAFITAGASLPSVVAFLTAAQSAGLDSVAITYGLLGPQIALARLTGALFIAVCAGICAPASSGDAAAKVGAQDCCGEDHDHGDDEATKKNPISEMGEGLVEVVPYILLGIGLTAALRFLAPSTDQIFANSGIAGRVGALSFVLPLQLCEHTTVAVAAALQKAGATAGTSFAFLLAAPATNIPTLMVLSGRSVSAVGRMALALVLAPLVLSFVVDALQADMRVEADIGEVFVLPTWYTEGGAMCITAALLAVHLAGSSKAKVLQAKKTN